MRRSFALLLAGSMLVSSGTLFAQQYYGPAPEPRHFDGEEAMEQRGFFDGVRGADRDFQNHRRPDVNNRDEYRDPDSVPRWGQQEYREGFRRGYYQRVQQIYNPRPFVGPRDFDGPHDWR